MPFKVCGCVCISLIAYSLFWRYKFDWLTCADNFPKLVLKLGLSTLLLNSLSCLQVAGARSPPASAPGSALIGKRRFFCLWGHGKAGQRNSRTTFLCGDSSFKLYSNRRHFCPVTVWSLVIRPKFPFWSSHQVVFCRKEESCFCGEASWLF